MPTRSTKGEPPILTRELEIKNFKSLKNIKLDVSRINVFIGKPNSGKSNLLEALTLFNFIQGKQNQKDNPKIIRYNTLDNLFYDRDISNDIEINLDENLALFFYYRGIDTFIHLVNPSLEFQIAKNELFKFGRSLEEIQKNVPFLPKEINPRKYYSKSSLLDDYRIISKDGEELRENPIRRYEFQDGLNYQNSFNGYLEKFGENLFTIVQSNSKLREWISSFYEEYGLEFVVDFSSRIFEIQKKQKGIVYKTPFELTPDTFRRMLFHIAAIHSNKGATILFEEPESNSFPPYVKELSELIKADYDNRYFITTHSPYFWNSMVEDSKTIRDISFFYVYYEDYQTKIKQLTRKDLDNIWGNEVDVFFNIDSLNK